MEEKDTLTQEPTFKLEQFLQKNKFSAILAVLGIIILGIGVLSVMMLSSRGSQIEILTQESQEETQEGTIFVDLAGAVQKPGVYELKSGSRIDDLLIAAGGLSAQADREWVSRNMNLAQKLADGVKIYIPTISETAGAPSNPSNPSSTFTLININTASADRLDTLWGIGPVTAEKIITNRPYNSIEELRNKKIVKSNVWEAIKDKITVY